MRTPAFASLLLAAGCGLLSPQLEEDATALAVQKEQPEAEGARPGPGGPLSLQVTEGTISVTTVKDGTTEVPATFSGVTGKLAFGDRGAEQAGIGALTLDLASWDSGLALRDERVRTLFLGVAQHPTATFSVDALEGVGAAMDAVGGEASVTATGTLYLAGGSTALSAPMTLTRTAETRYLLSSTEPLAVSIKELGLAEPLQRLMDACQHESIADSVAVSVSIQFDAEVPAGPTQAAGAPTTSPAAAPSGPTTSAKAASDPKTRKETTARSPEMRRRLEAFRGKRKLGKSKRKSKRKNTARD